MSSCCRVRCRGVLLAWVLGMLLLAGGGSATGQEQTAAGDDGVLRKPIPERLIVLTFDDGPASHARFVAPLLKELGFGATFYVCGPDAFKDGKNWDAGFYLSNQDLTRLHEDGFEVANHTLLHKANRLEDFTALEERLKACEVPRPTTMCWPVYRVKPELVPELVKSGYVLGRGGHERPYRPTIDHPMDVPSFTIKQDVTQAGFIAAVRQATEGRVVVLTFHGVPDEQHPWVTLEPKRFKQMMDYLKRNHYRVIAMRDLAGYLDMDKAQRLAMTKPNVEDASPEKLLEDEAEAPAE